MIFFGTGLTMSRSTSQQPHMRAAWRRRGQAAFSSSRPALLHPQAAVVVANFLAASLAAIVSDGR
jgi:RNase P protein component